MASTYSNLKIQLMATGENLATWGDTTNVNLGTALEEAITGTVDVTFASANLTLTLTNVNTSQTARNLRLNLVGTTGGSTRTLTVPAIEKVYIVNNTCADSVTVQNATGTGTTVPAGKTMWVFNDATNVVSVTTHLTSLTLGSALPVASGGTNLTTFTAANNAIYSTSASALTAGTLPSGAGGTGLTTFTAANSALYSTSASALTAGTLPVTAGGTGQTTYTDGQLLIGNTTGNTLAKATLLAGTGIFITNGPGTINISSTVGTVTSVNLSTGSTGLLVNGATSNVITTNGTWALTGTLATANGGTNLTGFTAANNAIYSTSASALTAGTLPSGAGGTGLTTFTAANNAIYSTSASALTSGTLPATAGGTGQSSYAVGDILYASTTTALSKLADVATGNSLISGGVGVAPAWGKITLSAGASQHVSGTLPVANGGTNLTTFTAANNAIYSTSASALTAGTLPVTAGGTGVTTSTGSNNNVLSTSPVLTTPVFSSIVNTGTLTLPTSTDTLVGRATTDTLTNKTLVAPALGTPVSGTLTNCTFPALSIRSYSNVRATTTSGTATVAYTADQVVMQTASGTARVVNSLSATLDLATTDAVNGRDSAISTAGWYYVYAISNGTVDGVWLTTAATSPTLPSGYTYYARIGVAYASGTAFLLNYIQRNNVYSYTSTVSIVGGATGGSSVTTPTWVAVNVVTSAQVPATACEIYVTLQLSSASGQAMAAPNNSYGAYTSSTNPPPMMLNATNVVVSMKMLLESSSVYYAFSSTNGYLRCYGFTDAI